MFSIQDAWRRVLNYTVALEPASNVTLTDPPYSFFLVIAPQIALVVITQIIAKIAYRSEFLPGQQAHY